jgi:hypothetical protein
VSDVWGGIHCGAIGVILVLATRARAPRRISGRRTLRTLAALMSAALVACLMALALNAGLWLQLACAYGAATLAGVLVWLARAGDDDVEDNGVASPDGPSGWDWREFDFRRAAWEQQERTSARKDLIWPST